MIADFAIDTADGFIGWVLSLFPSAWEVPDWLTGLSALVAEILGGAAGMGIWIPWALIFIVVGGTYVLWSIGLLLKFARWVLGLIPTMGGG